ncbi:PRC-barrel domain-containing protein [Streptomyces sp. TRM68367]|uniref:PRC-barrel domain-containing protein n=1 Tax=Streptomyces sp. TRM68367 TaxID=2758415 RepID=UPI00165CB392|nr:PRC-barrel domain-containing protein [Streptomyces sp. TRM68367]MBC9727929.1 PRC-barrel domain-containing protein [Streptomyces sp. TRM68367]
MMLFSQVRGLPVVSLSPGRRGRFAEMGVLRSLTVDAATGMITHLRVRGRHPRRETVLAREAVHAVGPDAVVVRSADTAAAPPPHHDLPGRRILTEAGDERGTVLDVAFDPATGRVETLLTTRGELPAGRMLGLGDYALVVRTG